MCRTPAVAWQELHPDGKISSGSALEALDLAEQQQLQQQLRQQEPEQLEEQQGLVQYSAEGPRAEPEDIAAEIRVLRQARSVLRARATRESNALARQQREEEADEELRESVERVRFALQDAQVVQHVGKVLASLGCTSQPGGAVVDCKGLSDREVLDLVCRAGALAMPGSLHCMSTVGREVLRDSSVVSAVGRWQTQRRR